MVDFSCTDAVLNSKITVTTVSDPAVQQILYPNNEKNRYGPTYICAADIMAPGRQ